MASTGHFSFSMVEIGRIGRTWRNIGTRPLVAFRCLFSIIILVITGFYELEHAAKSHLKMVTFKINDKANFIY